MAIMGDEKICVGCSRYGAVVCAECAKLANGERRLRIVRLPLLIGGPICLFVLAIVPAWFALATVHNASYVAWRGFGLLGATVAAGAWLFAELRRPRRLRLTGETLTLVWLPGIVRRFDVARLECRRGVVRVAGSRAKYRITEDRYPGASTFLRALRVRAGVDS